MKTREPDMKTLVGTLFLLMGAGFFAMPHALPIDYSHRRNAKLNELARENANMKEHAEALGMALEDAISTYREDDKTVLVSAERQEAWIHALAEYRGSFFKPVSNGGQLGG